MVIENGPFMASLAEIQACNNYRTYRTVRTNKKTHKLQFHATKIHYVSPRACQMLMLNTTQNVIC